MSNFTVCRMCLAHNIKMHTISNTALQEIYENLVKTKLITNGGSVVAVCFICYAQLRKLSKMAELAQHSEKFLMQLCHSGIQHTFKNTLESNESGSLKESKKSRKLTQDTFMLINRSDAYNYSVTPIESISLPLMNLLTIDAVSDKEVTLKQESECSVKKDCDFKIDNTDVETHDCVEASSDSEDDVPLYALRTKQKSILAELNGIKKTVKLKRKKRKYRKDIEIDAIEMKPTKQQQIDAVLARAKSLNYLNSPYKCHLCYKGFVNEVTYSNHVEKHDEISGVHKCDICALRYHSPRLLRTHVATAHSRYYKCRKCEHVSQTINQARDHERWHEGFLFECQLCSKKFKKRTSYLTHTRLNHSTEHVCNLCGCSFVGKNGLLLHKSKSHKRDMQEDNFALPELDRYCNKCNIQFVGLEAYHRHLLTSVKHKNDNNSNECVICKQSQPDNGSLIQHMKTHRKKLLHPAKTANQNSIQAQLNCDVCGATFSTRSRLAAHTRRKHLGLKYTRPVVCEICGAQFKSAGALSYHQRRHTGSRPYQCDCGKRFSNSSQLRLHSRTHTGERPYSCHTCHKRFSQKAALNRHHRVHTGAKPYTCHVCAKCFSQSNSLKVHVQSVHLKIPAFRKRKRATQ